MQSGSAVDNFLGILAKMLGTGSSFAFPPIGLPSA